MIKAIVFDLDGMIHFTETLWSREFSRKYGVPMQFLDDFFANEFQECVVGKADAKVELRKHIERWDPTFSIDLVFESWFNYGRTDTDMLQLASQLKKKGIKVFLCTNNERHRMDHFQMKHRFDEIFDEVISSSRYGHKKPQEAIFRIIERKAGAEAGKILFCDDDDENCDAAEKLGFRVHRFRDIDGFKLELSGLI
jgi:putative hydrolase of the HAD superfamily